MDDFGGTPLQKTSILRKNNEKPALMNGQAMAVWLWQATKYFKTSQPEQKKI